MEAIDGLSTLHKWNIGILKQSADIHTHTLDVHMDMDAHRMCTCMDTHRMCTYMDTHANSHALIHIYTCTYTCVQVFIVEEELRFTDQLSMASVSTLYRL